MNKLEKLLEIEGMTEDELARISVFDSVIPGICRNPDCEYTVGIEPDQTRGWCEECNTNTVVSGAALLGFC